MENKIFNRVFEHYEAGVKKFSKERVVACLLCGSQNYHLDFTTSDVDTKIIIVPTFADIAHNKPAVNEVGFMENSEDQIAYKDIRLFIGELRKQNTNFVETLFTEWYIRNRKFNAQWERLVDHREEIARLNERRALQAMIGLIRTNYSRMQKLDCGENYPAKIYATICRVYELINSYISGCTYSECLIPSNLDFIRRAKQGEFPKGAVYEHARSIMNSVDMYEENILSKFSNEENPQTLALMEDVEYEIMKLALQDAFK